jgi:hypothetical protein
MMTIDDFRRVALSMPGAEELSGMGYPNFRAERKSFATIEDAGAVIRLTRDQQTRFMATAPETFAPASDGWGKCGSTVVRLEAADEATLWDAVATAWRNVGGVPIDPFKIADAGNVTDAVDDTDIAAAGATAGDVDFPDAPADVANALGDVAAYDYVAAHNVADDHDANMASVDARATGVDAANVLDATADVAGDLANVPVVNVVDVHDANVADVDAINVPDACNGANTSDAADAADDAERPNAPADVTEVAAVNVAGAASVESGDDLQNTIERLQMYWEQVLPR